MVAGPHAARCWHSTARRCRHFVCCVGTRPVRKLVTDCRLGHYRPPARQARASTGRSRGRPAWTGYDIRMDGSRDRRGRPRLSGRGLSNPVRQKAGPRGPAIPAPWLDSFRRRAYTGPAPRPAARQTAVPPIPAHHQAGAGPAGATSPISRPRMATTTRISSNVNPASPAVSRRTLGHGSGLAEERICIMAAPYNASTTTRLRGLYQSSAAATLAAAEVWYTRRVGRRLRAKSDSDTSGRRRRVLVLGVP